MHLCPENTHWRLPELLVRWPPLLVDQPISVQPWTHPRCPPMPKGPGSTMRIVTPTGDDPGSPRPLYLPQGTQVAHPNSGMDEGSLWGYSTQHSCQGLCGRTSGLAVRSDESYCFSSQLLQHNSESGVLQRNKENRQGLVRVGDPTPPKPLRKESHASGGCVFIQNPETQLPNV